MPTINYKAKFNKNSFELTAWQENNLVCGIDEVGRGCLAGPVVVAAAILHPGKTHRLLKDSKIMSPEERYTAYTWLQKHSWYAVSFINHRLIDRHNIYQATLLGMKRAYLQLMAKIPHHPTTILVDAMPLRLVHTAFEELPVYHFPFGEKKSSSIAAASILAKVTRDQLMHRTDDIIPGYGFAQHKGYATPRHRHEIQAKQESIIHRLAYIHHISQYAQSPEHDHQQPLFEGL